MAEGVYVLLRRDGWSKKVLGVYRPLEAARVAASYGGELELVWHEYNPGRWVAHEDSPVDWWIEEHPVTG